MSTVLDAMLNRTSVYAPTPCTVEGLPIKGVGYEVTGYVDAVCEEPKIIVEMHPRAFREAIGHLIRRTDLIWPEPTPTNKKKKPVITKVIYNPPATIVWLNDGDKVVSKAEEGDEFDWETGLAICVLKKRMDRKKYNRLQPYFFTEDPNKLKKVIINGEEKEKPTPLWETLVRMYCPNGEWEKIKKEWAK